MLMKSLMVLLPSATVVVGTLFWVRAKGRRQASALRSRRASPGHRLHEMPAARNRVTIEPWGDDVPQPDSPFRPGGPPLHPRAIH